MSRPAALADGSGPEQVVYGWFSENSVLMEAAVQNAGSWQSGVRPNLGDPSPSFPVEAAT